MKRTSTFFPKYQDFMPKGAGALFLIQIFATLGYSILYSTLILYVTNSLHMTDLLATSITGSFVALNYFLHLLGGYLGGRYFSYRSLFSISMVLQLFGCGLIFIPEVNFLLWGLSFFLAGCGLNVTCINCMVTQLFEPNDKRREAAFLWNYSGMNIGFFAGFALGGYFHLQNSYQELFVISGIGNIVAFGLIVYHWAILRDRATYFIEASRTLQKKYHMIGGAMLVALVLALRGLLQNTSFCNQLIIVIGIAMLLLLVYLALKQPTEAEKNKMIGFIILCLSAVLFWTLYQLAPMGLNLFIDRNVDRHFLGMVIAPQWVQNINTIIIILGGPFLSFLFTYLRERGWNISIPFQFSLALLMIGLSYTLLPVGISFANASGLTSFKWVLLSYTLQSTGELFISPIGYAMVGQLAPLHLRGLMMGIWMMIIGLSATLSDHFSKMALGSLGTTDPLITNHSFSHTFSMLGWSALIAGVVLFISIPAISRLIRERDSTMQTGSLKEQLG